MSATRRRLLGGTAAALTSTLPLASASATTVGNPDAELIRVCPSFAEAHLDGWYRYVAEPDGDKADDQDTVVDWNTLHWIEATPATTPEGWKAKALAFSAWHREGYDNAPGDQDSYTALLAGLLRDMVAPERNAIIARLAVKYGPLPKGYTAEGVWLGAAAAYGTDEGRAVA